MRINKKIASQSGYDQCQINQLFSKPICILDYQGGCAPKPGFRKIETVSLPGVSLYNVQSVGLRRALRRSSHIANDGVDDFLMAFPIHSAIKLVQSSREATATQGEFVVFSTSEPFVVDCVLDAQYQFSEVFVKVSGNRLREQVPGIDDFCAKPIKIRPGPTRIMRSLLDVAFTDARHTPEMQAGELDSLLLHSISMAIKSAPELQGGSESSFVSSSRLDVVRDKALKFINQNLSDPALSAVVVAEHCNVSTRYLHYSFSGFSTTVMGYIARERLQRSRAELMRTPCHRRSITNTAMRWGFSSPSTFSRAYRDCFGYSPKMENYLSVTK